MREREKCGAEGKNCGGGKSVRWKEKIVGVQDHGLVMVYANAHGADMPDLPDAVALMVGIRQGILNAVR